MLKEHEIVYEFIYSFKGYIRETLMGDKPVPGFIKTVCCVLDSA